MARVVMYSSYLCAFCWMAKTMLKNEGGPVRVEGGADDYGVEAAGEEL